MGEAMSEQAAEPAVVVETTAAEVSTEKPTEVDWKAKAREWEKRAKANADAATKLTQLEEAQKTEAQKLADRAEQAEKAAQAKDEELRRYRIAARHGLPEADFDDLNWSGSDEEVEARVARYMAKVSAVTAAEATPPARPRGDVDQGARSSTMPLNGDGIEQALRQKLGIT